MRALTFLFQTASSVAVGQILDRPSPKGVSGAILRPRIKLTGRSDARGVALLGHFSGLAGAHIDRRLIMSKKGQKGR